jgi:hypothetical protein
MDRLLAVRLRRALAVRLRRVPADLEIPAETNPMGRREAVERRLLVPLQKLL